MTALNRRAVATGALALSAILTGSSLANTTHGPAAMLEGRHPDSDIAGLFVQWVRALEAGAERAAAGDLNFSDQSDAIMAKVCAAKAATMEGLAIKAYISVIHELGSDDALNIDWSGGMMVDAEPHRSLVRDAVAMSPLLAAFVTPDGVRRRA